MKVCCVRSKLVQRLCEVFWHLTVANLSGETRKVETDWVAVGTFSCEGLSPVFQERAPWSIMDETNKAREHKKAQEEHRCGQIAPDGSAERLASTLVCVKVCENRRA